jgi:perosamine synthetase
MKIRNEVLPALQPQGGDEEIAAISEVIRSGWWGKGKKVQEFEREFAEMVGAKHAIAITSNSHGIDLVLKAYGITDGDVINPAVSFVATAMIPIWNGCQTNIVDVDPVDFNITAEEVAKYKTPNTKAVIAVNMSGVPAPIDEIREVYDGLIIEDCAHSCYVEGAGSRGDVAIWSFQAVKTMPCGDGGMITTNDTELYERLNSMTWFGVSSTFSRLSKQTEDGVSGKPGYSWDYEIDNIGYKCYMTDMAASICLEQMKKLPQNLEWRRYIRDRYNTELHKLIIRPSNSETVQYYNMRVPATDRDALIDYLASKKIHTSVHFKPVYMYKAIKPHMTHPARRYPISQHEWECFITIPLHNGMTVDDVDYVIYWVNKYFDGKYSDTW